MRTAIWYIVKVVAAVLLAVTSVVGILGKAFDVRDTLDTVIRWGWTWNDLLFVVMATSFWIVVIGLHRKIHRLEKNKPLLDLWPRSFPLDGFDIIPSGKRMFNPERGYAKVQVRNRGGYATNCIGSVVGISSVEIKDSDIAITPMRFAPSAILWDTGERSVNIPNDGVPRVLNLAYIDQNNPSVWELALLDKESRKQYPAGWYKIDVVVSSESELSYSVRGSIIVGLGDRQSPPPPLQAILWSDWVRHARKNLSGGR